MLTLDPPRTLLVVAAAIIDANRRVLVQRRPGGKQHGGLWEFPGGKVEPGEAPEAALVRELAEELGIVVAEDALTPLSFSSGPGIVLLLYRCDRWVGEPTESDGALVSWITGDALARLAMPPADVPLVPTVTAALRAPSRS